MKFTSADIAKVSGSPVSGSSVRICHKGTGCWLRPEEGFGSLGIRDTGSCGLPEISVGNQTLVLWKATITQLLKQLDSFTSTFSMYPHLALPCVHESASTSSCIHFIL